MALANLSREPSIIAAGRGGPTSESWGVVTPVDVPPYLAQPYTWVENTSAAEDGVSRFLYTSNSYSGADISATILVPGEKYALHLGDLQTISWSTHRENKPVRSLGRVSPCGFVKGPRTISGSLIFTQFDKYTFYRLSHYQSLQEKGLYGLGDMLPPFDIILTAANEYGSFSKMKIFGVTIVDEGGVMSIDDMVTEMTMTFMARGINPLVSYTPNGFSRDPVFNKIQYPVAIGDQVNFRI